MSDKKDVIKGLEEISDYFFDIYRNDTDSYKCEKAQEYSDAVIDAIALLKEQPEIVRCKDCQHGCGRGRGMYFQFIECEKTGAFHTEDWFCFDGKRR